MYHEEIEEGRRHSLHQPPKPPPTLAQRTRQVLITTIAFISFFSLGGLVGVTGPAIPSLAIHLGHRDETQLGSAFTCRGSGYLCGAFLASILDHRWPKGKHVVMIIGSLLAGLATLGAAFTSSFSAFLPVMALQGLGLGCVDTAANAVLIELWGGTKHVEQLMQAMHACFGVGAVASPAAVGGLGYKVAFVLCATVALLPLLVWTGGTVVRKVGGGCGVEKGAGAEAPRQEGGGEEDGLTSLLLGKQDVVADSSPPPATAAAEAISPAPALPPLPLWPRLSISFFLLIYVGIEVGYGGWIATYLLREHLTDSTRTASYSVSIFWGTITLGRLLAVPLALHLAPPRFLLLQLSITTLGVVLLLTLGPSALWGASLASAVFGLGMSSIFPSMMLLPETLGFQLDMKSTSAFMIGACLGEGVVPVGIGWVMGGGGGGEGGREGGTARFPWAVAGTCGVMWVVLVLILKGWTGGRKAMVVVRKEEEEGEEGEDSGGGS